ncbi:sulfur carrier protein ThiS [Zhaonella formicivorans]|jgi:sulfur carrier protein|uniref:sulfur carrier protein ThiS n=1 Tax=Zhaonella formicivorans TaxID=2528593 RepID=UPI0010D40819|nr:sulfur carrier protein ThiS [Zhaonella formicivorans]
MFITVNGKKEKLEREITVLEFLQTKGLNTGSYILLYNGSHLKHEDYGLTVLKENDQLEVLRFVGGG